MFTDRTSRGHAVALCLGLASTGVVIALHVAGGLERFELDSFDWRLEHCNRLGPSDIILHVDITDDALTRIHRWPWPRRYHAELIESLSDLGARAIVMDIVFSERQRPRVLLPFADSPAELAADASRLSLDSTVFDDAELARALRRAGNVYLTLFFDMIGHDDPVEQTYRALVQHLADRPDMTVPALTDYARESGLAVGLAERELNAACRRAVLGRTLLSDFGLTSKELAERSGLSSEQIDRILPGLKRRVAYRLVRRILDASPEATLEAVMRQTLPEAGADPLDQRDIEAAYDKAVSVRASLKRAVSVPETQQDLYPAVRDITPPQARLASACRDVGFVTFETGSIDGVLREIPLVARYGSRVIRQLAFGVLCDLLEVQPEDVRMVAPGKLMLGQARWPGRAAPRDVTLPVGPRGRLLLNWYAGQGRWETSFDHLAVGRVLEIPKNRRAAHTARRQALAEAVRFTTIRGAAAAYEDYLKAARRRDRIEQRLAEMPDEDPNRATLSEQLTALAETLDPVESNALAMVCGAHEEIRDLTPADDEERAEFAAIRHVVSELERAERLNQRVDQRLAELGPLVRDKVVFVGYTATAVADFVSAPVFERAPGVVAHANLFHTLYSQMLIHPAPFGVNLILIGACGLATSLITASRGPITSLLSAAVGLSLAVLALAAGLFYQWQIWVVVPAPLAAILTSWAIITMFRQLTEGRQRRIAFNRLGQYTSPALARRIAEDPSVLSRAETREVTCYFSDLKGFTGISERLGAERTQSLLNVYLGRMSETLDRHEAFVNKFLGDGIFVFFNPAVNPQPDHVLRACEAALDSQAALDALIVEQREQGGDEAFAQLRLRIGLATGRAVVGNCGSDRKFDYTCIGDTVNLAARLESANKAFGTRIMASESTRREAGDAYAWRYLGGLQVVGKTEAVGVYELLGRAGEVDADSLEYAERFEQGVQLYQQQRWTDCTTHFSRMLARRPDDAGLTCYIDACQQIQRFGVPEHWTGGIELTEK